MPSVYTRPSRRLTAIASVIVLASVAFPASAGTKAPIVYASESASAAAPMSKPAGPAGKVDKSTQRIEFRYPGSPAAAAGRVEMASVTSPKLLSPAIEQGLTSAPQFAAATTASTASKVGVASLGPVVETAMLEPVAMSLPKASLANAEVAVIYGDEFEGLPTANGEIFYQAALTAAHPSLPLPSLVAVTNPATGKEVVVRVNDRGPFEDGATLQVSRQAARALGFEGAGKAELTMRVLGNAPAPAVQAESAPAKAVLMTASLPAQRPADELLGGDELAGGTTYVAAPAKTRTAVAWPEPPKEWGVAPAKTKVTAAPDGSLYVQLASFSDIGNAETLYRGLKADLPVEIVPARVNGTDYFRVRVGPVATREDAQQLRDRLNAEGKGDGRVVSAE